MLEWADMITATTSKIVILGKIGLFDKIPPAIYACTSVFLSPSWRHVMATTIFLIVTSCACLVIGIYFFFVRPRQGQKPHDPE
jgi:hypothetical protein